MTRPNTTGYPPLKPLPVQYYERYLPTAFDESLTLLEKVNKLIYNMNAMGIIANDLINQWNDLINWLTEEAVKDAVDDQLQEWLDDGTLADIINEDIFADLNADVTANTTAIAGLTTTVNDLLVHSMQDLIVVTRPPYNVDNTGVTDVTVKLQELFDLAMGNASVRLYFPEGTYKVSDMLRLHSDTDITFHQKATIFRTGTINKVFLNGEFGNTTYASGYDGDGNIHIRGGKIDLNGLSGVSPTTTMSAFDLSHGHNISVREMEILNGIQGHYMQITACDQVYVENNLMGDVNYLDMGSIAYEIIQIETTSASAFPTFGSYDGTISQNIYIRDNVLRNGIRGIGNHAVGTPKPKNIQITGNKVLNMVDHGISLYGFEEGICNDNQLETIGGFGINVNAVDNSIVSNNILKDIQKHGIFTISSTGNIFEDNLMTGYALSPDTAYQGIRATDSVDNLFKGNRTKNPGTLSNFGFYIDGTSTGNQLEDRKYLGSVSGNSTSLADLEMGDGMTSLFNGDLFNVNDTGTLAYDIRSFSQIIVMCNDNSSSNAQMVSMTIPKVAYVSGASTSRFRCITDGSATASDRVEFSFPDYSTIRLDVVAGTSHIRRVLGVN